MSWFKRKKKYHVSYFTYHKDGRQGTGNSVVELTGKIKSLEDMNDIRDGIIGSLNGKVLNNRETITEMTIITFKRL